MLTYSYCVRYRNFSRKCNMADLNYQPVHHNHADFVTKAKLREGFTEAYEGLELEYALAD